MPLGSYPYYLWMTQDVGKKTKQKTMKVTTKHCKTFVMKDRVQNKKESLEEKAIVIKPMLTTHASEVSKV